MHCTMASFNIEVIHTNNEADSSLFLCNTAVMKPHSALFFFILIE